jgi:ribosomal protein S18 acetylase RimI-like enzyme
MVQFVVFDPTIHYDDYYQLLLEHRLNTTKRMKENHQVDLEKIVGSIPEYVKNEMKTHVMFKTPEEIVYLIYVDGEAAGMGRMSKIRKDAGEIKQMYNRPKFRGRGLAKQMLSRLMEKGRALGYSTFLLDVWKLGYPARHIYTSAGFEEIERYPESESPSFMAPYYMFMEKKE